MTRITSIFLFAALLAFLAPSAEARGKPQEAKPAKAARRILVIYPFDSTDNSKMAERMTDSMRMRASRLKGPVVVDGVSTDEMLAAEDRPTLETPLKKVVAMTADVFGADLALWGRITGSGDNFTLRVKALDMKKSRTRLAFEDTYRTQAKRQLNWFSDEILVKLTGKRKPGIVEADPKAAAATPTKGPNLVPNGDFEKGRTSPDRWSPVNGMTTFYHKERKNRCLRIDTDVYESEFKAWMKRFKAGAPASRAPKKTPTSGLKYDTVAGNYGQAYYSDWIPLTPGKRYKVSLNFRGHAGKVWVRGYGTVEGMRRRVYDGYLNFGTSTAGKKWEHAIRVLRIPKEGETAAKVEAVRIVIFAYWPPGVFYFDNVGLWEVDEARAAGSKPAKTATAGKGKTPKKKSLPWEPIKVFLEVPKSGKAPIVLLGDGKVRLVDFRQLQSRLGAMRKKGLDANNPVVILYKSDMPDEWITKAFDAAIAAGFANVQLKSQP